MSEVLEILKDFSPVATIALALLIILQLVRQTSTKKSVDALSNNHLHEVKESLNRIENILTRSCDKLDNVTTGIEIIKTKLNNKDK